MNPHFIDWIEQNCTKCSSFLDIWLATDEVLRVPQHQEIEVTCKIHGVFENKKLYVCDDFQYDAARPEIVYEEKRAGYWHKRFFCRIGSIDKILKENQEWKDRTVRKSGNSINDLVYSFVCKVTEIDCRGYMMQVCVNRVHVMTGMSKEAVFKEILRMVSEGFLVRASVDGGVFLRPPNAYLDIAQVLEIGKRKVNV